MPVFKLNELSRVALTFLFFFFFFLFLVFRDKGFSVLKKTRVGIRHGGADLLSHHTVSASINVAK